MRPSFLLFFKYKHFFPFSQLTCLALTLQHEQKKEKNTSKYADKKESKQQSRINFLVLVFSLRIP
ncbi:hypothetical protein B1P88_05990 [Enterococcus faecium]|nr:hypothetical protein B1P86_05760 [Enterococcus faecium]OOL68816.1 hypothetical protein B1P88_05990 [Enterococcus faecium]